MKRGSPLFELAQKIRHRLNGRVVHMRPKNHTKGAVLISYITYPFITTRALTGHTNYWEAQQMANEFLTRGYTVDIIDSTNTSFVPQKTYDICIDTQNNLARLAPYLGANCIKVLHTTTTHWLTQNTAAYMRATDLLVRKGVALAPERQQPPSHSPEVADVLLVLGNKAIQKTYEYAGKPIVPIEISAVSLFEFQETKNFEQARSHFMWLGGAGAIHKGADLTLEAFASLPNLTLTMCGKYLYPEFESAYTTELHDTPNIKSAGYVDTTSEQFETLRLNTGFLVFPSCAEGQSGGVVAAMHAGLIPIISRESGVDVEDFGFILKENTIEEIKKTVAYAASLPPEDVKARARKAWQYARAHFTREKYAQHFSEFVDMLESKNIH